MCLHVDRVSPNGVELRENSSRRRPQLHFVYVKPSLCTLCVCVCARAQAHFPNSRRHGEAAWRAAVRASRAPPCLVLSSAAFRRQIISWYVGPNPLSWCSLLTSVRSRVTFHGAVAPTCLNAGSCPVFHVLRGGKECRYPDRLTRRVTPPGWERTSNTELLE